MPFSDSINSPASAVGLEDCASGFAVFPRVASEEAVAARVMRPKGAHTGGESLPCLSSNNSIEVRPELSAYQRKNAFSINENLTHCIERFGIEKVGFLTLTFAKNLTLKESNRRFNSLATNFLDKHFETWLRVVEFTKGGRPHFHLIVICREDIRTGFNFGAYLQMTRLSRTPAGRRKHAVQIRELSRTLTTNLALKAIWSDLRRMLPEFQFGRSELIPIRKTAEALSRYVGGYIRKSMEFRPLEAKGARLIAYAKNFPRKVVGHAWTFNTAGSRFWRMKVSVFAGWHGIKSMDGLNARFGPRWAWWFRDVIQTVNLLPHLERGSEERRLYYERDLASDRVDSFWDSGMKSLHVCVPKLPELDGKPIPPPRELASVFEFHCSNWFSSPQEIAAARVARNARLSADRATGRGMFHGGREFAESKAKILAASKVSRSLERACNYERLVHPEPF